jgi:hypothetical protein
MKITHNPIPENSGGLPVNASEILKIQQQDGQTVLTLADGRNYIATQAVLNRHAPAVGDYLVARTDGYEYASSKAALQEGHKLV